MQNWNIIITIIIISKFDNQLIAIVNINEKFTSFFSCYTRLLVEQTGLLDVLVQTSHKLLFPFLLRRAEMTMMTRTR